MCESGGACAIGAARGSRLQACAPGWDHDKTRRCSPAVAGNAQGLRCVSTLAISTQKPF